MSSSGRDEWHVQEGGGNGKAPGAGASRLGVEDSNLGIRIQSPLSYH